MGETVTEIPLADLKKAQGGSWYFIAGCGGDLTEWTEGYERMLAEAEIGKPTAWYRTVGAAVNRHAEAGGKYLVEHRNAFQDDLVCLLFPLDGLDVGRLAMFKIQMEDRWFDDVVDNMRTERF